MAAFSRIVAKIRASLTGRCIGMSAAAFFVVIAAAAVVAPVAHAQTGGPLDTLGSVAFLIIARICQAIAAFLGDLLIIMVGVLINVAQYNNFVGSPAVGTGWVLIRDTTNMFFILIMLLIAFGTMLGIDQYSYKSKTVNKLLLAAFFVNFSRTFCGLMIDFAQVVMLTFVYGFRAAGGGNFLDALQLNTWLAQNKNKVADIVAGGDVSLAFDTMLGTMLASVLALISLVVVVYMTVMLVIRIIFLWLLVVVSPAAFFLRAVPLKSAEKYYGEWWGMFTGQLIFGPVMAFFLWLSLATVANTGLVGGFPPLGTPVSAGFTEAFTLEVIRSFVIAICLLLGGTKIASKMAGDTAGLAKTALKKAPGMAVKGLKGAGFVAGKISLPVGKQVRDADGNITREKIQLGALAGAGLSKIQSSGLYRAIGADKDYNKLKEKERRVKALDATGQTEKASALREELFGEVGKSLPRDKIALRKTYEDELKNHPGSVKQKAAALKLAEGGLLEESDIKEAAGSDKAFKKLLTDASKKAGKMFSGIDASKPGEALATLEDLYATSSRGDKAKFARQAVEGAMIGRDGKPRDENAAAALSVVDAEDYRDFPKELKQKLLDAMVATGASPIKIAELEVASQDKNGLNGLTGNATSFADAAQARLIKEQGLLVGAGATEKAFGEMNPDSGRFTGASAVANRASLQTFMGSEANRKTFMKSVPANLLLANGGDNDLTESLFSNMNTSELTEMAKDLDIPRDQVFAIVQAAKNQQGKTASAAIIANDYADNSSAMGQAFSQRTYKYDVGRLVSQVSGDVVSGAASAASTGLKAVAVGAAGVATFGTGGLAAPVLAAIAAQAGSMASKEVAKLSKELGEKQLSGFKAYFKDAKERLAETGREAKSLKRGVSRTGMKV